MLSLMDLGSQEVSDDVWFRAVQAVAGSTADRPATTEAIAKSLESGSLSVPLVSTAGCATQLPSSTFQACTAVTRLSCVPSHGSTFDCPLFQL